jgi:hypothetical protein
LTFKVKSGRDLTITSTSRHPPTLRIGKTYSFQKNLKKDIGG